MSVTFPQSPTNGQQVTDPTTGAIWVWNNSPAPGRWTPVGAGVISNLIDQRSQGYVNKIRNPGMAIWQRGFPIIVSSGNGSPWAYTADGWIVGPAGANCSVTYGTGLGVSWYCMILQPVTAGMTECYIANRIESYDILPLAGQVCTIQCRIRNNTSGPITPVFTTFYPNRIDNWTSGTQDVTTNFQTVPVNPNGSTLVALTFSMSPAAVNGYQITIYFGNALAAATSGIAVTDFDLRATPGVPLGINNNPPRVELRSASDETARCQRYYYQSSVSYTSGIWSSSPVTAGNSYWGNCRFPVPMRTTPTVTFFAPNGNGFPMAVGSLNAVDQYGVQEMRTCNASSSSGWFTAAVIANADLN